MPWPPLVSRRDNPPLHRPAFTTWVAAFAVHVRGFLHRFALRAAVFLAFVDIATAVRVCALFLIGHLDLLLSFSGRDAALFSSLGSWEFSNTAGSLPYDTPRCRRADVCSLSSRRARPIRPAFHLFLARMPAPSRESPTANGSHWYGRLCRTLANSRAFSTFVITPNCEMPPTHVKRAIFEITGGLTRDYLSPYYFCRMGTPPTRS